MTSELGKYAYKSGKSIETNPFAENTQEFKDFNKGWNDEHKSACAIALKSYKKAKTMTNKSKSFSI